MFTDVITPSGAETSVLVAWARSGRIRHWDRDGRTRLRGTGQESFRYFWVKGYNCLSYFYYRHHTAHAPSNIPLPYLSTIKTSPTPYTFGHMPPIDTLLTLGPFTQ